MSTPCRQLQEEISVRISAQFQGQITLLQEQMNQLISQSQAAPVILGASPPQHRSSVASTPVLFELGNVQLPIDVIQVSTPYRLQVRLVGSISVEAGWGWCIHARKG